MLTLPAAVAWVDWMFAAGHFDTDGRDAARALLAEGWKTWRRPDVIMYAVFADDEIFPQTLSHTWDGAECYLPDCQHAAAPGCNVRVVKLTIEDAPTEDVKRQPRRRSG